MIDLAIIPLRKRNKTKIKKIPYIKNYNRYNSFVYSDDIQLKPSPSDGRQLTWYLPSLATKYRPRCVIPLIPSFDYRIWFILRKKCNLPCVQRNWSETVMWIARTCKGHSLGNIIVKLVFAATVYVLWRERNNRMYKGEARRQGLVLMEIISTVRAKVSTIGKGRQ